MQFDLDSVAHNIHQNAVEKGFWDADTEDNRVIFYLKQIAMVHSECSEVLEAIRKEKGEHAVVEELADIIIRVLDLWSGMFVDEYVSRSLSDTIYEKVLKNEQRPRMHGVLA